jgi:anti-sigma B factor antagonist
MNEGGLRKMETLDISKTQYKRCDLVTLHGRVDSYTAPKLEEQLNAIMEDGRYKIVMDMDDVNFVSSKGWWVLIETQKNCKRYNRGEVVLANIDDKISSSLDLIGLSDYFKIYDNVTDAVGGF